MFKLAIFLRVDGVTINPFYCSYLRSYVGDGVVVITQTLIELVGGIQKMNELANQCIKHAVIVGDENKLITSADSTNYEYKIVKNITEGIRFLSKTYPEKTWWLVSDNHSANHYIKKGLIMNVHLSKSYDEEYTNEWVRVSQYVLNQSEAFDKAFLETDEFELVSNVRCLHGKCKSVRHFIRRNNEESRLLAAMYEIITKGFCRPTRTGVNTRALFGQQFEYRMIERVNENGQSAFRLPLLTTKKMFVRGVFAELKWFLSGGTNSKTLEQDGVNIWKGNTSQEYLTSIGLSNYHEGETGPIYGFQWRHWNAKYQQGCHDYAGQGIDQVQGVIQSLRSNPYGRRHIINAWNVEQLDEMCLPPCHVLYQFMVHEENEQKYLTLMMYQRSCDVFLGLPFNICSLGMFLTIMAHHVGMKPYKIIHSIADFHLYETHIDAAMKQIQRDPCCFPYISIASDNKEKIEDYNFEDIKIEDYYHHNPIKAEMLA